MCSQTNLTSAVRSQVSEVRRAIGHQTKAAKEVVSLKWWTCTCRAADQLRPTWPRQLPSPAPEIGMHAATD